MQKDTEPLKDGDMIYQKDKITFLMKRCEFWSIYLCMKYTWHLTPVTMQGALIIWFIRKYY